jgi:hypothetical protein
LFYNPIFVTLLDPLFATKTLPKESRTIPTGEEPVVPYVVETPDGVILVTLLP